jgi:hypothetical protein
MNLNKLSYYKRRISVMSFPELTYRVKWKFKQKLAEKVKTSTKYQDKVKQVCAKISLQKFIDSKSGDFFFEHFPKEEMLKKYEKHFSVKELLLLADKYLNNDIPIFEIDTNLGKIDWNKDYKTGKVWPKQFVSKIHHGGNKHGTIRYIWELNRHNFLVPLACAYYLTGKKEYAEKCLELIESWIEQNPYLKSANWFSGLEAAVRLINWIWCLKLLQSELNEEKFKRIVHSIYLQYDFIINNLSLYSSANNHLTGELAGIKIITTVFPEFSKEWNVKSERMLNKVIDDQIFADGVGAEQATDYLIFILDLYTSVVSLTGMTVPEKIKNKLIASMKFIRSLLCNREKFPIIGDSDDANPFNFGNKDNLLSVLSLLSLITEKKFNTDEKVFWLTGLSSNDKSESVKESHFFSKGGYFVSNQDNAGLIFDCGKLGYLSTASHGHCDALSILFSYKELDFLVDNGCYVYHGNKKWRNYFRSTRAHNTVQIDNREQSQMLDDFVYGRKATVTLKEVEKDRIIAEHDGYNNVIHQRELIHEKGKVTIIDRIKVKDGKKHQVSLFFNLHPKILVKEKENIFTLTRDNVSVNLKLEGDVKIHNGETEPINGWYSESFGKKVKATCIEARMIVDKDTVVESEVRY